MKTLFTMFLFLLFTLLGGCNKTEDDVDGDGFVNCHEATKKWPRYADPFGCLEEGPEWHEDPDDPNAPMATAYVYGNFNPAVHDCNDGDSETNPGAVEVCDGIDNDCDGLWDEGDADVLDNDCDGDGFVALDVYEALDDCDPWDAATYPGAPEIPEDGRDNNCDGCVDEIEGECSGDTGGFPATGCRCSTSPPPFLGDPGCRCDSSGGFPVILLPFVGYLLRRKRCA
ncbi:putative metal-binding motif-containing protein [Patescibacteria group bacterium]|nr:putative metal-binding motif-containing protein [Patescibacteria group bacterium]